MRNILIIFFTLLSLALSAQNRVGLVHPRVLGQPTDTTKFGVILLDTTTKAGTWATLNPEHFVFDGSELSMATATDSVFVMGDSLCAINNGDTLCVYQDSVFITNDSFCIIQMGDTTCVTYSGGVGANTIYTSDGTLNSDRDIELDGKYFNLMNAASSIFKVIPAPGAGVPLIGITGVLTSSTNPIMSLANTSPIADADAYVTYNVGGAGVGREYGFGIDKSAGALTLSSGLDLADPMLRYYGDSDSLCFLKDIQVNAGIIDKDGDIGTSAQILTSTGTEVNWIDQSALDLPISSLSPAVSTNTINNDAYKQEWQWDGLAGSTGLKLSSTSTAATGSTQKLFEVSLSGANAAGGQTTYAGYFSNTHTGTVPINYGVCSVVSGGTINNTAVYGVTSSVGSSNSGVHGLASGSLSAGVRGTHTNGGISVLGLAAGSSYAVVGEYTSSTANADFPSLIARAGVSGNEAPGFGTSLDFTLGLRTGFTFTTFSNGIVSEWVDTTYAAPVSRMTIEGVSTTTNDIVYFEGDKRTRFNGRVQYQQGADIASAVGAITLGSDGNIFEITGTNAVTLISNVNWQNGSEVTLFFTSIASLTDGVANSGTNIGMELAGNTNFTGSADDSITLVLSEIGGTQRWREKCRSVN